MCSPCEESIPQQEGFHKEVALCCGMLYFGFPAAAIWHLQNPVEVSPEHFILMEAVRYGASFEEDCNIRSWMLPAGKLLDLNCLTKPRAIPYGLSELQWKEGSVSDSPYCVPPYRGWALGHSYVSSWDFFASGKDVVLK